MSKNICLQLSGAAKVTLLLHHNEHTFILFICFCFVLFCFVLFSEALTILVESTDRISHTLSMKEPL